MIVRPSVRGTYWRAPLQTPSYTPFVKNTIYRLAVTFPSVVRLLITLSAKGYLTPHLWRPWLMNDIARAVWPTTSRPWVGQTAKLFNGMKPEVDPLILIRYDRKAHIRSGAWAPTSASTP
jgi:hypothetical protein